MLHGRNTATSHCDLAAEVRHKKAEAVGRSAFLMGTNPWLSRAYLTRLIEQPTALVSATLIFLPADKRSKAFSK